jgi:undecaprenyl phosphate-alpha-L-ara4N flippase subunit ArnF
MSAVTGRKFGLTFVLCAIVLSSIGQLAMKMGMQELSRVAVTQDLAPSFLTLVAARSAILWTMLGLSAYVTSLLVWLAVLVRFPLSYAYPLLSLTYVLVYLGATHWPALVEPMTTTRSIGTLLIIVGVALVSGTNAHAATPQQMLCATSVRASTPDGGIHS